MKINNWLNNFIEEQKQKAENMKFLKEEKLEKSLDICEQNFRLIECQVNKFDKINIDIYKKIKELNERISIQKGRITRQTNEQNQEKESVDAALNILLDKVAKLEKKVLIKAPQKEILRRLEIVECKCGVK